MKAPHCIAVWIACVNLLISVADTSAQPRRETQRDSRTTQREAPANVTILELRGGKKLEAASVRRLNDGLLEVTTADGKTTRIRAGDVVKQTRADAPSRTEPSQATPSRRVGDKAKFTFKLRDGQVVEGVNARQVRRGIVQITDVDGKVRTARLTDVLEWRDPFGKPLKATIGRNGEIIWVIDNDGNTGSNTGGTSQPTGDLIPFYDALLSNQDQINVRYVSQRFLALGFSLHRVRMHLGGSGTVRVAVRTAGDAELAYRTVSINPSNWTDVEFDPPLTVEPGDEYKVYIRRPTGTTNSTFKINVTKEEQFSIVAKRCPAVSKAIRVQVRRNFDVSRPAAT